VIDGILSMDGKHKNSIQSYNIYICLGTRKQEGRKRRKLSQIVLGLEESKQDGALLQGLIAF
jgi:hypothetical protein